ncbi:MAG: nucleotidyltransferase [Proteobacteria bacterium]|nr:nucleotidyltransferase [Pseudomonadota bacterium]
MNENDYLKELLASQALGEDSDEWKALDEKAAEIEGIVRAAYPGSDIHFTHGGSRAKGTMIREDYDLDEVCYFQNDDAAPGDTLEEIYENLAALLGESYQVRRKRSPLRLIDKKGRDVHVDFVPGRYVDQSSWDVFIHQNDGDKERLKTNIVLHVDYVHESGCTDVIMLAKLWKTRNGIAIKTFPLELLVIEALKNDNTGNLDDRFRRVLGAFADAIDELSIEDPANPTGNDLSHALPDSLRRTLSKIAADTLKTADDYGWEHVFGKLQTTKASFPHVQVLRNAAAAAPVRTAPWNEEE